MILSGSAVQVKGLASDVLWWVRKRAMAVSRSWTDRKSPCFGRRLVSLAKMRRVRKRSGGPFSRRKSTAFSQEFEVGVKGHVQRGWRASQSRTFACLWVASVSRRAWIALSAGMALDEVQEGDELLMAVARDGAACDLAGRQVEGGEQRRGAVALVIVGHHAGSVFPTRRGPAAFLQGQVWRRAGLGAVQRLDL